MDVPSTLTPIQKYSTVSTDYRRSLAAREAVRVPAVGLLQGLPEAVTNGSC